MKNITGKDEELTGFFSLNGIILAPKIAFKACFGRKYCTKRLITNEILRPDPIRGALECLFQNPVAYYL